MRTVLISDTHNTHLSLDMPDGDVLIHSGDGTNRGTTEEVLRLNAWFNKLKSRYKHILYVPGNHDFIFQEDPDYARELMQDAIVLIDESIEIEGKKIYGSPWTPTFWNWAFMKLDGNLTGIWESIPSNLDILITHGPPAGILDETRGGENAGSDSLFKAVVKKTPRFHVFGHIHEAAGEFWVDPTTFINAAMMPTWDSDVEMKPIVIEV